MQARQAGCGRLHGVVDGPILLLLARRVRGLGNLDGIHAAAVHHDAQQRVGVLRTEAQFGPLVDERLGIAIGHARLADGKARAQRQRVRAVRLEALDDGFDRVVEVSLIGNGISLGRVGALVVLFHDVPRFARLITPCRFLLSASSDFTLRRDGRTENVRSS